MLNVNVAVLGPPMEHREALESQLSGRVGLVQFLPDSRTFLDFRSWSRVTRLIRGTDALWGTQSRSYLDMVLRILDEKRVGIVIAFWGTIPLPDLQAIKKARPRMKVVLLALSYPVAITELGVARQRFSMILARRFLDGIICPTQEMVEYLRRDLGGSHVQLVAIRPGWPAAFLAASQKPVEANRANVVFVGRTDFSSTTSHPGDDVRPLLSGLLDEGIQVHHLRSKDIGGEHPLRRPFAPMPLIELIAAVGGHDAALMAANLEACRRTDRYDLAVPDRLISSVAAGIPIAIPRRGFAAAKTYLADYPFIEFDNPRELLRRLSDRLQVDELRAAAWNARLKYTAEAQADHLCNYLQGVLRS